MLIKENESDAYYDGVIDGLSVFVWWKSGIQYVGTYGRTLREAKAKVEEIRSRAQENRQILAGNGRS